MSRDASDSIRTLPVLGTPLAVASYAELRRVCVALAREPRCAAIEFANTHVVTMRRHEPEFRELTGAYDYFVPDGMPLVWCLNRRGADLPDRVYGPTFMREFLLNAEESTHYLLGGSKEAGAKIQKMFRGRNPKLTFVGSFHGMCGANGTLDGAAETAVIEEINRLSPDFIWVGFGTPKQQAWVKRHKHLLNRGVILSVGFAFDVNAGMKVDAPRWMQRAGLTWVFRLCSEPRRLATRYLRYNTLFLFYLLRDGFSRRAEK